MAILRPQRRLDLALAWYDVWPRVLAVLTLAALPIGATLFLLLREDYRTRDLQGAPALEAMATVESLQSLGRNYRDPIPEFRLALRIGEKRGDANVLIGRFPKLAVGQEVRAWYQVGNSGRLYIGQVEPK